jgi:predicted nucleic acid-binding protein
MKKILSILLFATIFMVTLPFSALSQAIDESSANYILSNKQAQSQTKAMVMLLNLKAPVIDSVNAINLKYQLLVNDLRAGTAPTEERKDMHAWINEQKNAKLRNTLTEEQYSKYIQSLERAKVQLNDRLSNRP